MGIPRYFNIIETSITWTFIIGINDRQTRAHVKTLWKVKTGDNPFYPNITFERVYGTNTAVLTNMDI